MDMQGTQVNKHYMKQAISVMCTTKFLFHQLLTSHSDWTETVQSLLTQQHGDYTFNQLFTHRAAIS